MNRPDPENNIGIRNVPLPAQPHRDILRLAVLEVFLRATHLRRHEFAAFLHEQSVTQPRISVWGRCPHTAVISSTYPGLCGAPKGQRNYRKVEGHSEMFVPEFVLPHFQIASGATGFCGPGPSWIQGFVDPGSCGPSIS